jgi:hypothetical protein
MSSAAGNRLGKLARVSSRVSGGAPNPLMVEEFWLGFFFLGFCAFSADDDDETGFRHSVGAWWFVNVNPLATPHQRITKMAAAAVVLMVEMVKVVECVLIVRCRQLLSWEARCNALGDLVTSYMSRTRDSKFVRDSNKSCATI